MNTPLRRRLLAALGAATVALTAAAPADAVYRYDEGPDADGPVIERTIAKDDTGGQKGCTLAVLGPDGKTQSTITYAHGYSFSAVNKATGKTHTYTCNNGVWVETVSAASPYGTRVYDAEHVFVQDPGWAVLTEA